MGAQPLVFRARSIIVLSLVCLLPVTAARAATLPAGFSESLVASGLSSPTAMQFAPDGRLFVCEQSGHVRVIKDGVLLSTPFVTLPVDSRGERGLLGIAFDPAFASNGYVYLYYTTATSAHNRISRFTANGDVAASGSEFEILNLEALSSATNHNGGAIDFGADGKLYVAVGENANTANSQTLGNRLGKMLRINPDGSIPTDNPFNNETTGVNRAIWALGLRNPFTFAFDSAGTRMFINDVGQSTWEEINEGRAGANYGWPNTEGATTNPAFDTPRYAYSSSGSDCAITGGAFYTPLTQQFPAAYSGDYFFADFCGGWIRRFDPAAGGDPVGFASGIGAPVDLKVSDDGSLYYLARGSGGASGTIYRIVYGAPAAPTIATQPANQLAVIGASATFSVIANGAPPLQYRWQRNNVDIAGAAGAGASSTIGPVSAQDNGAKFRVRVTNAINNALSNEATLTVTATANNPTATITQPTANLLYEGGSVITYAGTGTDPQDGTLPSSAFTWRIDFHHDTHAHPFLPSTTGAKSGTITIPTAGETSANVWYRIYLTVTDAGGLTHTVQRDVFPRKVRLTLNTSPAGLQVRLDGQPVATPLSFDAVVGMVRNLSAQSPQAADGITYAFASWSDAGAEAHDVSTPAVDTTYTVTHRVVAGGAPPSAPSLSAYTNGLTLSLWWTPSPGATSYRLEAGSALNAADLFNGDIGMLTSLQSVVPPGTYFARIRSVGPGGASAPSNEVSVTLDGSSICSTPPPAPSGYAVHVSDLTALISWNPSPSATSYVLEAGTSAGEANLLSVDVGSAHSISATGPAGLYFTRVRAVNACGSSSPSAEVPVTLGCAGPPPAPALTLTNAGGIVTLSWTASPGASTYRARVGTAPGLGDVFNGVLGSTNSLTADARGITGTYFVGVFAANACGTSAASNEVAVTVP
jgi:glucose/arabinose dehydrogenase